MEINGALTASSLSNVVLTNSAFYYNVYWQINGELNVGANSAFRGTALVNGAISLANGSSMTGRVLTKAGAVLLDANTIDIGLGPPLPIEIISFTGKCEKQNVLLKWTTATEINNDYFLIARSSNGVTWEVIGKMDGAGNSITRSEYKFIDTHHTGEAIYYRLSQTDFDGQMAYSSVIAIENCEEDGVSLSIYPNPVNETLYLDFTGEKKGVASIEVFNSLGRKVCHVDGYQSAIDVSGYPEGLHFVYVDLGSRVVTTKFVLKK